MTIRQTGAQLYKNYILKKRAVIQTLIEVLLPVLVVLGLVFLHGQIEVEHNEAQLNPSVNDWKFYPQLTEILQELTQMDRKIAIVPGNHPWAEDLRSIFTVKDETINERFPFSDTDFDLTFASRQELNSYVESKAYISPEAKRISAAVYLDELYAPNFNYVIRMNSSFYDRDVPRSSLPPIDNVSQDQAYDYIFEYRSFVALQTAVDSLVLHKTGAYVLGTNSFPTKHEISKSRRVNLVKFPVPAYDRDVFAELVGGFLGIFFTLAFIWPVTRIVTCLVEEKELKIKQGMIMMGLDESALTLSWWMTYSVIFFTTSFLISLIGAFTLYVNSNFVLIFLYYFAFCNCIFAFAFFMSTLFSKAKIGSTVSSIVFLGLYFIYILVQEDDVERSSKLFAALSPTVSLALGSTTIARLESQKIGVTIADWATQVSGWSVFDSTLMFCVSGGIFTLLGMYFQRVIVGEYGVADPWYFFVTKQFWVGTPNQRDTGVFSCFYKKGNQNESTESLVGLASLNSDNVEDGAIVQSVDSHITPLVKIRNLRKAFPSESGSDFVAVNSLSLDMYPGQVFALLGENGAGKSTTINCLTGLYPPSENPEQSVSSAWVDGYDIRTEINSVYKNQGVCMQHDILYPYLSVREHLHLYGSIKGMNKSTMTADIESMINNVGLGPYGDNKMDALAGTLSGGQMRKLSVGIALLNNPKIVVLDEPSSGMDVNSQRFIWDLILKEKQGRTIILTSHFMEEVEALADTIAIMASGRLMCCGTSLFLKEQYGVGYSLTIAKEKGNANIGKKIDFVGCSTYEGSVIAKYMKQHYPFAELTTDAASETTFRMAFANSVSFPDMLDDLDSKKKELYISSYGLSATTMTEVFLRAIQGETREEHQVPVDELVEFDWEEATTRAREETKTQTFVGQVGALMKKRFRNSIRDRKALLWSTLYPLLIMLFSLISIKLSVSSSAPALNMSVSVFDKPNLFPVFRYPEQTTSEHTFIQTLVATSQVSPVDVNFGTQPRIEGINKYLYDSYFTTSSKHLRSGAICVNKFDTSVSPPQLQMSLHVNRTAAHAFPMYTNLISNTLLKVKFPNHSISSSSKPWSLTKKQSSFRQSTLSFTLVIALAFVAAANVAYLIKERVDGAKHLQMVSGTQIPAFWLANYLYDIMNFPIALIIVFGCIFAFKVDNLTGDAFFPCFIIITLYGLASPSFVYVLSFLFNSPSTGQNGIIMINFLGGIILLVLTVVLSTIDSTRDISKYVRFVFRFTQPAYCLGDGLVQIFLRDNLYPGTSYYDLDIVGYNAIFLVFNGIVYLVGLIKMEQWAANNTLDWILSGCKKTKLDRYQSIEADMDEDVVEEKRLVASGACDNDDYAIVLKNLTKVYPARMKAKPHVAVDDLSFAVKKGECLAYLGPNGAGKSTALKMLTGYVEPTKGNAILAGYDITDDAINCRKHMGYVPQFDALMPLLTGRDHLELFARLRRIPDDRVDELVEYLLTKLGLTHLADRPAGTYSGGNRRKLSIALALSGNPDVMLFDEISTGVDVEIRRRIWRLVNGMKKGRSIVQTTHNLEEAEALSDRLCILTSGKLRALGTPQHLRSRFGKGWMVSTRPEEGKNIVAWFQNAFPGTECLEEQPHAIKLKIPINPGLNLAKVFRIIESQKQQSGILAYSVSEYSLDQIFVEFVRADLARKAALLDAQRQLVPNS